MRETQNITTAKIAKLDNDEQIELDVTALREVLRNPAHADLPVAIYSVAGNFRSGKSFFLNAFLHYLNSFKVTICLKS